MPRTLSVAAAQFELREVDSFASFADQVRSLLDDAREARLVVLPELITESLFTIDPDWRSHEIGQLTRIADFTDEYVALFTAEAARRDQWILAGSHLVRTEGGHENVAHLFSPSGDVHAHAKTHIFPAEADWDTQEGDSLAVYDIDGVTVGIAICYEAEIPEVCTTLTALGAEVLLTPSYTFTEAGFWRVRHCAAARAIEDQVYVVHCPAVSHLTAPLSPGFRASLGALPLRPRLPGRWRPRRVHDQPAGRHHVRARPRSAPPEPCIRCRDHAPRSRPPQGPVRQVRARHPLSCQPHHFRKDHVSCLSTSPTARRSPSTSVPTSTHTPCGWARSARPARATSPAASTAQRSACHACWACSSATA
ncbi:nitrilase-related carbon-nitrogen hydrolase [Aeromicrobium sp. UC242_57]|uniref:nitrilase-related carbon-nitrogen hydrolase n=1 Tax=Aeromicrobium sp. UC242_57 TaxID=3374624 RepID=UPI003791EA75